MTSMQLFREMTMIDSELLVQVEKMSAEPWQQKKGKAECDSLSGSGKAAATHRRSKPKLLLIAAIVGTMMVFLMGAAVYTRWSNSIQQRYNPSEDAKQQAEKSGLSVMYDPTEAEDGSVLTATDQGITVTVVQSLVDERMAQIVLRVEGFTPSLECGVHPRVWWTDTPATLGGDEHFWCSTNAEFDNGTLYTEDGDWVYEDGAPVEEDGTGWKGRYIQADGSMELVLTYQFQETSAANLGKELQLHFTGFGVSREQGPADLAFEKLVEGNWDLHWVLNGSDDTIRFSPELRLSDNVTLMKAEISQLTVKAWYQTDTYWDGWEELGILEPNLAGVKLKDGTLVRFSPASNGYEDMDKLIYYAEFRAFEGMVDMDQVEALAYYDGREKDANGEPTIPVYKYVPIPME